jgi:hypothetical protein
VLASDGIGTYGNELHLPLDHTKFFTVLTLAAMLLGYLAGLALVPRGFSQETPDSPPGTGCPYRSVKFRYIAR